MTTSYPARMFSDFAGIAAASVPLFVAFQRLGVLVPHTTDGVTPERNTR